MAKVPFATRRGHDSIPRLGGDMSHSTHLVRSARSIAAVLTGLFMATTALAQNVPPSYVSGEVLIKFRDSAAPAYRTRILADLRATNVRELGRTKIVRVQIAGMSVEQAVARFRTRPEIEVIEPNYI